MEVNFMTNSQPHIPPGMLMRVIQDKQDKIAYYEQLHKMTSDRQDIDIISTIHKEEIDHYHTFINLYAHLFGEQPSVLSTALPQIYSFVYGVKNSIRIELDAYDLYSNIFFTDPNIEVRNAFVRALTDENRHAAKYTYIFTKLLESRL